MCVSERISANNGLKPRFASREERLSPVRREKEAVGRKKKNRQLEVILSPAAKKKAADKRRRRNERLGKKILVKRGFVGREAAKPRAATP